MSATDGIRTKVIASPSGKKWTWRAPLIMRAGIALVELRAMNDYASEVSAKQAGERHLRRLFSDIQIDR